jgi:predicted  nucleic acid-binding Zn-ribbon protein
MFSDGSKSLLSGCSCGSKFFFFVKKGKVEEAKNLSAKLTKEDRINIEKDVEEIVDYKTKGDGPVFLGIESIRILKPGQYELDLVDLFKGKPLVYKLEDGKYIIDLVSTFNSKHKD